VALDDGAQRDCLPCTHRDQCLRTPDKTKVRQGAFLQSKTDQESYSDKMKRKIDSPEGRIFMVSVSPQWNRCSATCSTSNSLTALRYAGESK